MFICCFAVFYDWTIKCKNCRITNIQNCNSGSSDPGLAIWQKRQLSYYFIVIHDSISIRFHIHGCIASYDGEQNVCHSINISYHWLLTSENCLTTRFRAKSEIKRIIAFTSRLHSIETRASACNDKFFVQWKIDKSYEIKQ